MKNNFKRVRPEDFDVERLMAAAREGRLFIEVKKNDVSKEHIIKEVRAYVQRIRVFVSKEFSSSVDELWEHILSCEEFVELMTPGDNTKKCRAFNKYNVIRIIGVLREKGVYKPYSDRKYIALLEETNKDSSYRSYLGMGLEQRELLLKLRSIVAQYKF